MGRMASFTATMHASRGCLVRKQRKQITLSILVEKTDWSSSRLTVLRRGGAVGIAIQTLSGPDAQLRNEENLCMHEGQVDEW